jgi:hypothetical protein
MSEVVQQMAMEFFRVRTPVCAAWGAGVLGGAARAQQLAVRCHARDVLLALRPDHVAPPPAAHDHAQRNNGRKPEAIIYYRDGVADSQFPIVLEHEYRAFRQVCCVGC